MTPEEDRQVKTVIAMIASAIGSPLQPRLAIPTHLLLTALAHMTGQLARMTLREPEDVMFAIRDGHKAVSQAMVDEFQRRVREAPDRGRQID